MLINNAAASSPKAEYNVYAYVRMYVRVRARFACGTGTCKRAPCRFIQICNGNAAVSKSEDLILDRYAS